MSAIELRGVSKRYGAQAVVDGVSLAIESGETFCFIGPSGSGKSTALRMINRLVEPSTGSVFVEDHDVRSVDAPALRRRIGYVIQDVGLIPHYTIARNVGVVPELLGWSPARRAARVAELLETVGLPESAYGSRYPRELSGGQRQRIGIARALAADPPIVLLDEPFSALDPISRARLQDEFIALSKRLGKTFVLVTHDMLEAVRLANRIGVMREGRLVQCGAPRDIIDHPADEGVRALIGRDRYRLRLMTTPLLELCADAPRRERPSSVPDAAVVSVRGDVSAWDALDAMESVKAGWIRVDGVPPSMEEADGAGFWVSRADVLGALGS
jgi:osmoprotectant transport system ATP-binding protein